MEGVPCVWALVVWALAYGLRPLSCLSRSLLRIGCRVLASGQLPFPHLVIWLCRMCSQQDQGTDRYMMTVSSHRTCGLEPF